MGDAYRRSNEYIKLREGLGRKLKNVKKIENKVLQVDALTMASRDYCLTGEHGESERLLVQCFELLDNIRESGHIPNFIVRARLMLALRNKAMLFERRSISVNGFLLRGDAEKAIEIFEYASNLVSESVDHDDITSVLLCNLDLARLYCSIGEFDSGICFASICINDMNKAGVTEIPDMSISDAQELLGLIYLKKFSDLKCGGQDPFNGNELLQRAKSCFLTNGSNSTCKRTYLCSAQVNYFLGDTDKAYMDLAVFLDISILYDPLLCGGCEQKSGEEAVTKRCSGCKSTCYCSSRCQTLHWKRSHTQFDIRHKILCPLLSYWRKRWRNEMKEISGSKEKGIFCTRVKEQGNEIVTETCRSKFKKFFEGLLQKKEQAQEVLSLQALD